METERPEGATSPRGPVKAVKFWVTTSQWDALQAIAAELKTDVSALLRAGFADVLRQGDKVETPPFVPLDTRSPVVQVPTSWVEAASGLGRLSDLGKEAVRVAAAWSRAKAARALEVPGAILRRSAKDRAPSSRTRQEIRVDADVVRALMLYVPQDPATSPGRRGLPTRFRSALAEARERAIATPNGPLVRPAAKEDPMTHRFVAPDALPWPRDTYPRRLLAVLIEACVPEAEREAFLVAA